MSARWSLRRRLTSSFAATTATMTLAIAIVAALYLRIAVYASIDALVREEIEELSVRLPPDRLDQDRFDAILGELQDQHPANPLAARLVEGSGSERRVFEAGTVELLVGLDAGATAPGTVQRTDHARHFAVSRIDGERELLMVIDGSADRALMGRFAATASVLGVLGAGLGLAFGAAAARSTARLLSRVADGARRVRSSEDAGAFAFEDAPVELDALTEALRGMLVQIHRRQERSRLFAAGLAHELGAPVQNLLAECEIALMRERSTDEYRETLRRQREELHDLARALRNLTAFVALETPPYLRADARFDLSSDVSRRVERERGRGERRSVTLTVEARGPVVVDGDRDALGLAVQNLVANAVDWSPEGGNVTVRVDSEGASARVVVDDQGPGVPAEERERIFGALHEGRGAPERRRGFGLGLSITRGVARAHGGDVSVTSSPIGGARFVLALPLAERGDVGG